MTYTIAVCTVKTPVDGQRNCPKHVEFYSKNKFEKLVLIVDFIVRVLLVFAALDDATINGTDKVQDGGLWKKEGGSYLNRRGRDPSQKQEWYWNLHS